MAAISVIRVLGKSASAALVSRIQALVDAWAADWLHGAMTVAIGMPGGEKTHVVPTIGHNGEESVRVAWLESAHLAHLFGVAGFDADDSKARAVVAAAVEDLGSRLLGPGATFEPCGAPVPWSENLSVNLEVALAGTAIVAVTLNHRLRDRLHPAAISARGSLVARGEAAIAAVVDAEIVVPLGNVGIGAISSLSIGDVLVADRALIDGADLRVVGGAVDLPIQLGAKHGRHAVQPMAARAPPPTKAS